jgi:hypothetical protein
MFLLFTLQILLHLNGLVSRPSDEANFNMGLPTKIRQRGSKWRDTTPKCMTSGNLGGGFISLTREWNHSTKLGTIFRYNHAFLRQIIRLLDVSKDVSWCSDYRDCHWTQGLRVQTRPRWWILKAIKSVARLPSQKWSCRPHLGMICGILKNPAEDERDTSSVKLKAIFRQVPHTSLLTVSISAGIFQRALVDESGMIRTQMGKSNRSEMVAVLGTHCAMPCCIHTDRPNHSQSHSISHTHDY